MKFFCCRKDHTESLPTERIIKVPNVDKVIEEGKKTPSKFRNIKLHSILGAPLPTEMFTATGWPSVSGDALKTLAGKVSAEYDFTSDACNLQLADDARNPSENKLSEKQKSTGDVDKSDYGTAFLAFEDEGEGREACHAIAALCEVCSIDSLISNFILPLQVIAAKMSFWRWSSCLLLFVFYLLDVTSIYKSYALTIATVWKSRTHWSKFLLTYVSYVDCILEMMQSLR